LTSNPPILFLIFNRPEHTEKVFSYIQSVKPARLYIAADGPRSDVKGENEKCMEARRVCSVIDWDCEVKRLYRDENLGCGRAVSQAITWFFESEEEGVILEDDCLPNEDFYGFCATLLDYHRHNNQVMHIGGTNFQNGRKHGDASYYFSCIPHVWGWATWRRAWKHYDFNLSDLNFFLNRNIIRNYVGKGKVHDFWQEIFCKMNQKMIDTWDYQWQYAIWNSNGLSVIPQVNLVTNIGFGTGATHTTEQNPYGEMRAHPMKEIHHPEYIVQNKTADNLFFSNIR
jgi:hypothetical protein